MRQLYKERIDLHIHCVNDGGLRMICDACEAAQMLHGYSVTNAIRMRLIDRLGSIEVGKDAKADNALPNELKESIIFLF